MNNAVISEKTADALDMALHSLEQMSDSESTTAGQFRAAEVNFYCTSALCAELAALRVALTDKQEGGAA